jgi:hypothetical protein
MMIEAMYAEMRTNLEKAFIQFLSNLQQANVPS